MKNLDQLELHPSFLGDGGEGAPDATSGGEKNSGETRDDLRRKSEQRREFNSEKPGSFPPFRVGIARCEGYAPESVQKALQQAVDRAGGWPPLPSSVLLKANLLAPRAPEDAATTHPEILRGVVLSLRRDQPTREIVVADSPGFLYAHQREALFERTGLRALAESVGCGLEILSDDGFTSVSPPGGVALLQAHVAEKFLRTPAVVNVAKMKTHVETRISACIKNIFGIADTPTRKRAHSTRDPEHLIQAIVDLYSVRPPAFAVLDAVEAMEGNGPSHGTPKFLGWILAGENALAVDLVASHMMGYPDPRAVPLLREAMDRGLGPTDRGQIALFGGAWEEIVCAGFQKATTRIDWVPSALKSLLYQITALRPALDPARCTSCGICAQVCPVGAISLRHGRPEIDRRRCVSCMCCHEMCPPGAMKCQPSPLARLMLWWRPPSRGRTTKASSGPS